MEEDLQMVFGLSRDAVVAVSGNLITYINPAASELFGPGLCGKNASGVVPEAILSCEADSFVSSAEIGERRFSVRASRSSGMLLLVFADDGPGPSPADFVSGPLIRSMLSSLFNVGLAIDLVTGQLGPEDPKLKNYISILYHSYFTMKRLVCNLGTAASIAEGTLEFLPRTTDLARLCSDIVSTVSVLLGGRAKLEFATSCGELCAVVDPDKIERMILNLLVNSIEHTPAGGKITLGLRARGGKAVVSVDDEGSGIPPEILKNVFTRYESCGESGLAAGASGGLGLGIARGIAELHGGSLIIESRVGVGTSVRVMIPLDRPGDGRFASAEEEYHVPGMDTILTELSGELDSASYTDEFRD